MSAPGEPENDKPIMDPLQVVPVFVERYTTPPAVPANRLVSLTARQRTRVPVKLVCTQLLPVSMEANTPLLFVPANRFPPLAARVLTLPFVRPESTGVQVAPLLVERKIPSNGVPTNRFVPTITKELTREPVKPTSPQFFPLFVERKAPLSVPANRFVPLTARE
jgi:hypothetical protein